jgi:hypothetical protein
MHPVHLVLYDPPVTPVFPTPLPAPLCPQLHTERLEVPFFVKSKYEFERTYPRRTTARMQVERQVRPVGRARFEGWGQGEGTPRGAVSRATCWTS